MLMPQESTRFRRDLKRVTKRHKDIAKLKNVVRVLAAIFYRVLFHNWVELSKIYG
jgi:mRNA-degrading endonuclease YafQ of YafQ-DinJ toxin-antitoxin module